MPLAPERGFRRCGPRCRRGTLRSACVSTLTSAFSRSALTHDLVEMTLGSCAFLLQNYSVREWVDNSVIQIFVSDLKGCWRHIRALDLRGRYGVTTRSARDEGWGSSGSWRG